MAGKTWKKMQELGPAPVVTAKALDGEQITMELPDLCVLGLAGEMEENLVPSKTALDRMRFEDDSLPTAVMALNGKGHRLHKSLERAVTEKCVFHIGAAVVARLRSEFHLGVGHSDLLSGKAFELVSQETT
jgi:hypothetical protein